MVVLRKALKGSGKLEEKDANEHQASNGHSGIAALSCRLSLQVPTLPTSGGTPPFTRLIGCLNDVLTPYPSRRPSNLLIFRGCCYLPLSPYTSETGSHASTAPGSKRDPLPKETHAPFTRSNHAAGRSVVRSGYSNTTSCSEASHLPTSRYPRSRRGRCTRTRPGGRPQSFRSTLLAPQEAHLLAVFADGRKHCRS